MPQRSPTHEPPLAAIAHNIGLAHALAPTSTDDFPAGAAGNAELDAKITDCDRKARPVPGRLDSGSRAGHRRPLDHAGPKRNGQIPGGQARHRNALACQRAMSRDEIASVVSTLADALVVLHDADPADKAQIYTELGLRLTSTSLAGGLFEPKSTSAPAQH